MKQSKCTTCRGHGEVYTAQWEYIESVPCADCKGTGKLNPKHPVWKLQGEKLKAYRMDVLGLTLRSAAVKYGMDAGNLSKMERGIIQPVSVKHIYGKE